MPHRFTVADYYAMADAGVFNEDSRVELVEGSIVDMSPIGSRHAGCVKRLNSLLSARLGVGYIVGVQDPVRLGDISEPQPDIAVLRSRADMYSAGHPGPSDVALIIEVADTTVEWDRSVKVPLYARFDIDEVWVVDLGGEAVEQYRGPTTAGYETTALARRGETLTAVGVTITVEEILGP